MFLKRGHFGGIHDNRGGKGREAFEKQFCEKRAFVVLGLTNTGLKKWIILDDVFQSDLWIRVYKDGSAQDAVKHGGSGVYVEYPDGTTEIICVPLRKH